MQNPTPIASPAETAEVIRGLGIRINLKTLEEWQAWQEALEAYYQARGQTPETARKRAATAKLPDNFVVSTDWLKLRT